MGNFFVAGLTLLIRISVFRDEFTGNMAGERVVTNDRISFWQTFVSINPLTVECLYFY